MVSRRTRIGFGDQQQGVEGADQLIGLGNGALDLRGVGTCRVQPGLGLFQPLAQPVERRAQVVRHRIGDLAQAFHQAFNPVQHAVEIFRQHIEFIMRPGDRHPASKVAGHDLAGGAVNGVQAPQHVAAHQASADHTEAQDQDHCPRQGGGEHPLDHVAVMYILGHQQIIIASRRLE